MLSRGTHQMAWNGKALLWGRGWRPTGPLPLPKLGVAPLQIPRKRGVEAGWRGEALREHVTDEKKGGKEAEDRSRAEEKGSGGQRGGGGDEGKGGSEGRMAGVEEVEKDREERKRKD